MPEPIDPNSPPASPAPPQPGPKPPPAEDPDYLAKLRQENGWFRQRYQEQVAETGKLQEQLNAMSDYDAVKGQRTALEQQLRGDRLLARMSQELTALGVTDPAQQALVVKASDLNVSWDDQHNPQGDFSPLKTTVETLGLTQGTATTDSGNAPPGEGGTQAEASEADGKQTPPPPNVSGATYHAPGSANHQPTYEDIVDEGHNILARVRSEEGA
jgi:hypothetical protein